jgi:hypothetical protein
MAWQQKKDLFACICGFWRLFEPGKPGKTEGADFLAKGKEWLKLFFPAALFWPG